MKRKKIHGSMKFLSDPCYLPIFEGPSTGGLTRYTDIWRRFLLDSDGFLSALDRIKEYNGRVLNDVVVFDTEQDKMWFILKWS